MNDVEGLLAERYGAVAKLTLNRPERLNAINWNMVRGILDFVDEVAADPSVRAVLITGAGRAFSSGDDIVMGMGDRPVDPSPVGFNLGQYYELTKKLMSMPKPVIAAINGRCHGAGWVIANSCDIRLAKADAILGDIRAGKAIFAGQAMPLLLPRLIGQSRAMDILVTGRVFDATEGERYGLVAKVFDVETFEADVDRYVDELANGPTVTYAAWKLAVNRSTLLELDGYTSYERNIGLLTRETADVAEGRTAFQEKRAPKFTGR